jgi:hypothetical protein
MRHVDHQIGADIIGNGAKPGEVDNPRIGAAAGDDQLWPILAGKIFDFDEIDAAILRPDPVGDCIKPFA